jgi:hypothetical protein
MAGADNFGLEEGKAQKAIEWMNAYAKRNDLKFEARPAGGALQTIRFGTFQFFAWNGDWSSARNIVRKASAKLAIKVVESGYHEKQGLLYAMLGTASEYAKVYSSGRLVGNLELVKKSGQWMAKAEGFA